MPIAKRRKGERKKKFVSRCISDDSTEREFPNRRQRTAVCFSKARKRVPVRAHIRKTKRGRTRVRPHRRRVKRKVRRQRLAVFDDGEVFESDNPRDTHSTITPKDRDLDAVMRIRTGEHVGQFGQGTPKDAIEISTSGDRTNIIQHMDESGVWSDFINMLQFQLDRGDADMGTKIFSADGNSIGTVGDFMEF